MRQHIPGQVAGLTFAKNSPSLSSVIEEQAELLGTEPGNGRHRKIKTSSDCLYLLNEIGHHRGAEKWKGLSEI